jgi:acyl-CoA reductase-like NAD-dependent aldehyde dehydrogenase
MSNLPIIKTYKNFIGGQFPRTESGRHFQLFNSKKQIIANVCLSSKKDVRNAQVAARNAFSSWQTRSSYNRSQILYRIAEMLQGRSSQFTDELVLQGMSRSSAQKEVFLSIDRIIYYAGWCDKFQQIFSSVNSVSSSHHNFSVPEPTGVVAIMAGSDDGLIAMVSALCPAIAGGNTVVYLASQKFPLSAVTFAEVLLTSDLPSGVINILTGNVVELSETISSHMDINALVYTGGDVSLRSKLAAACSINVKRFFSWNKNWNLPSSQDPYLICDLQEIKTCWHPIENIGSAGSGY